MTVTRISPRVSFLAALILGLSFLSSQTVFSGENAPNSLDSIKSIEQKTHTVVPTLVQATVGLSIVGGPGMGSGVVISEDGYILTAGHVVPEAGKKMRVHFSDGKVVEAEALGADKAVDAGLAKITKEGKWPHVKMGKSAGLKKGEWVLAIGNPGGIYPDRKPPLRIGRILSLPASKNFPWIQTDATVAPGDSGGPLFNLEGEVIGIHSNISPDVTENRHVAIDDYHVRWADLTAGKQTGSMFNDGPSRPRSQLGIRPEDIEGKVKVKEVIKDSPAEKEGIKAGDTVLSIDDKEVKNSEDLYKRLGAKQPGSPVKLSLERSGEKVEVTAKMARGPQIYKDPQGEFKEFLEKHGKLNEDGNYEFQVTPETQKEFDKLAEKYGQRRGRNFIFGFPPRIDDNDKKLSPKLLESLAELTKPMGKSVVKIYQGEKDDKPVALGTVIGKDGYILTKASELKTDFYCVIGDREFDAKVVAKRDDFDLALIKVDATDLTPVKWASLTDPSIGSLLITPNHNGKPLAWGVVSNDARKIRSNRMPSTNRAVLGIQLDRTVEEAKLDAVSEGGPADKAGLRGGDIILKLNEKTIEQQTDLLSALSAFKPGDTVNLEYKRGDKTMKAQAKLGDPALLDNSSFRSGPQSGGRGRRPGNEIFSRFIGASNRKDNFPEALTHDTPLKADNCGGPILNLAGQAVGLNIARFDRTGSYALTYKTLQPILEQMIKDSQKNPKKNDGDR